MRNRLICLIAFVALLVAPTAALAAWSAATDTDNFVIKRDSVYAHTWTTKADSNSLDVSGCSEVYGRFDPSTGDASTDATVRWVACDSTTQETGSCVPLQWTSPGESSYAPLAAGRRYVRAQALTATSGGDTASAWVKCVVATTTTDGGSSPDAILMRQVSATGPLTVDFAPAAVEATAPNQFNVVGHGLATGDGPYRVVATGGTTGFTMSTWTIAKQVYAIRIDDNEFSLTDTIGGSALNVTSTGDAISYQLQKMTPTVALEVLTAADTTGELVRTAAYPCSVNNEGKQLCLEMNASTFISDPGLSPSHPNPAIRTKANGYFAGSVTTAVGSPRPVTTDGLRYIVRNMYPTLVGTPGVAASGSNSNQTRILHSHLDTTRMVTNMTAVVSTPTQDTGNELCALSGLSCAFVEQTVAPSAGVASAWTWIACGTDLTDGSWARPYCTTVVDP